MINRFDWTARWALYFPDKVAFSEHESGRTLTWRQVDRLATHLAHHLIGHFGANKGDRIAILSENSLEHMVLFAAAQKTGLILVPLNFRLAPSEIAWLLQDARPLLVIASDTYAEKLPKGDHLPIWRMEELAAFCESKKTEVPPSAFRPADLCADDPIFILYTSGTTGFPKGAIYTHQMLFWNSVNTSLSLAIDAGSRTINCMPLFHTGGWNVLITPLWHHGGYTCLMRAFDAATVLRLIEVERPTIFMGVPTMLKMMAERPEFDTADLSSLYYVIVGGEAMPLPLIERWHRKGVPVRQGYGMTEVGPNLTSLHQDDAIRKMGSIGRANFYVEYQIVDEAGRPCAAGQPGELLLRGPMVTPGYWQRPKETQAAFIDGWFRTGDQVVEDEEHYLFVVDRIKNMYISGGENVYPAEVERVLLQHPAVREAAVTGVPDERWGEVGKAFVVRADDTSEDELIDYCRQHLAHFKVPRYVVFVESLPKTETGKLDRKALKQMA